MNIYRHELKSLFKPTIIWTLAIISLAAIYFSVFPNVVKEAAEFRKLMEGYPAQIRAILNISLDNLTSILGFYAMIFSFISLCGAIQAMNYGASVLSKESRERTADFLLVKPVSRPAIVNAKILAALTMLLVTNALYYAAATFLANAVQAAGFNNKLFFMISATLFFIQLIFFALGLLLSVFFNRLKSVLPITLGVVFGLYILGALLVTENDDIVRFLFPLRYFDVNYIVHNTSYEAPYLISGAVIVVVAVTASYVIYSRKDIHSVS